MAGLADLPDDACRHILLYLDTRELCKVAGICRHLRLLAQEDAIWYARCRQFLSGQLAVQELEQPDVLQRVMSLGSMNQLYQVLVRLGGWPEGLWRSEAEHGPYGVMLDIRLQNGRFLATNIVGAGVRASQWLSLAFQDAPQESSLLRGRKVVFTATVKGEQWDWQDLGCLPLLVGLEEKGDRLVLQSAGPGGPATAEMLGCRQSARTMFRRIPGVPLSAERIRSLPPLPCVRGDTANFPALAALKRLEGVSTAYYGSHGAEILQIRLIEAGPAPAGCPIQGMRLEGRKVLGDPNVPSGQVSFVADASRVTLGTFDGSEGGDEQPRHAFVYHKDNNATIVDWTTRITQDYFVQP
ncbi:hypothetical protein WJX72_008021 [[Myrmecia] bisecta]|uniref:F-box domain-containing protein n=1 Tax=[Myrmecia] bisecta TaxID=41462 RepID=A0AAW1PP37_9CHLO